MYVLRLISNKSSKVIIAPVYKTEEECFAAFHSFAQSSREIVQLPTDIYNKKYLLFYSSIRDVTCSISPFNQEGIF